MSVPCAAGEMSSKLRRRRQIMRSCRGMWFSSILGVLLLALTAGTSAGEEPKQFGTPKGDEGTRIFKADEHPFYSGQFRLAGQQTFLIGSMQDVSRSEEHTSELQS